MEGPGEPVVGDRPRPGDSGLRLELGIADRQPLEQVGDHPASGLTADPPGVDRLRLEVQKSEFRLGLRGETARHEGETNQNAGTGSHDAAQSTPAGTGGPARAECHWSRSNRALYKSGPDHPDVRA